MSWLRAVALSFWNKSHRHLHRMLMCSARPVAWFATWLGTQNCARHLRGRHALTLSAKHWRYVQTTWAAGVIQCQNGQSILFLFHSLLHETL